MLNVRGKGLVCKEVEFQYLKTGTPLAKACIVNQEEYKGVNTPHFTNLIFWGEVAEDFARDITKGCIIDIKNGILKHPTYENKEGRTIYNTEVTVFEYELLRNLNEEEEEEEETEPEPQEFKTKPKPKTTK